MASSRIDSLKKQYADNQKRYFAALANEYRKAGDLAQSIALCRQHLPEQPNHISGHIVFGQALFEAGELAESRQVFETALSLDPENLIALRHLGDIASQAGDVGAAREWYTRILHADPRNEEIQGLLRGLPEAPAAAAVAEPQPQTPDELSDWAADLAAEEPSHSAPTAQPFEAVGPPPGVEEQRWVTPQGNRPVAEDTTQAVDAYHPPTIDLDEAPDHRAAAAHLVGDAEIPLPPPPFEQGHAAAGAEPFDLDFGAGDEVGRHLSADPAARPETPPIGMEAIFESQRSSMPVERDADVGPATPPPTYGGEDAFAPHDFEPEQLGGRNLSEEMQAIFGGDESTVVGGDELGLVSAEFQAPEREFLDDDAFAPEEIDAAAAAAAAPDAMPQAFVTETMAELYLQQGFRDEALNVYRQLLAANPHDRSLRERVQQLESGARASIRMVAIPDPEAYAPAPEAPAMPDEAEAFAYAPSAEPEPTEPEPGASWGAEPDVVDEPPYPAPSPAVSAPRTARDFFGMLATRRAPAREALAELPFAEGGAAAPAKGAADDDALLAHDLASPAHTSEPIGFEGATATGVLSSFDDEVSGADLAAGAPVATPEIDGGAYHPALDDAPAAAPESARRTSVPDMLASAFRDDEPAAPASFAQGSLDRLFGGRTVGTLDERAAASLASAFTGEHESEAAPPSGKPTRPADAELSLDRVFRTPQRAGTPVAGTPTQSATATPSRSSAAFSFDQFFAEGASGPETPQMPAADPGEVAASDIEQFNSWLEGLKKK